MSSPLRLVFLGSDPIALPLLNWLWTEGASAATLVAIFTQPDRPAGRGQKIAPNAIKAWALEGNLPIFQPEKLTDEVRAQLAALAPDVSLVMAYGHILRDAFIVTPRLGTLNLHTSLLPSYRGASPIQTAVACGERETGVTLMRIVRKLDAGPVADKEKVSIGRRDTALEIESKLASVCVPLVARNLPRLAAGQLEFIEQSEAQATFCRRLNKEDGGLDFQAPASVLAARINGLFPWPGCCVQVEGQLLRLGLAEASGGSTAAAPGAVIASKDELAIATGEGALRLLRLQRPGGKMLPVRDFLRGFSVPEALVLPSTPMTKLVASEPFAK